MATPLNPEDINYFSTQRRRVKTTYDLGAAQNQYQRNLSNTQYAQSVGDLTNRYDQMRQRLPGSYAKRGLFNSGIYQRGLQDFQQNKLRDFGNLAQMQQQRLAGFTMTDEQLARMYQETGGAGGDIDMAEAARKAAVEALLAAR